MDDSDYVCPLCCEELDISDRQFFPCKCGYQVCMWCWHRIRESESGLCPACRTPYGDDPHEFSAVDVEEVLKANKEKEAAAKKERERLRQQSDSGASSDSEALSALISGNARGQMEVPKDRTQLANMRVIRRNLVYAVGLPPSAASEDTLRKPEYFGQYGKISKIVLNRSQTTANGDPRRASASAYVTFVHKEDTLACILALDGFYLDGRNIRASYGTSKYCSAFIKNVRCNNPECTYLHQMGDVEDTFTKQEIQAGYVTSGRDVLARQQQIVAQALSATSGALGSASRRKAGGGGPSGTGRSCANPVFPPPTYDEPAKSASAALVPPPPPPAPAGRSLTAGSGFPTISAANAVAAPSKIVRSSSAGGLSSTSSSAPAPKGTIGSAVQVGRKGIGAGGQIPASSSSSGSAGPPVATAASVVAGVHSVSGSSEPPAPHTTLTPLTPLKRSTVGTKGANKAPSAGGTTNDSNTELHVSKSGNNILDDQNRTSMAAVARQQPDMTTKLTSLRSSNTTKKQNGVRSVGSNPGSPSSSLAGNGSGNGSKSNKFGAPNHTDNNTSLIGGAVIAAPMGPIGSTLGNPIPGSGGVQSGGLTDLGGGDGLGGLGGEIFNGPLKSSGTKSAIGSGAPIGSGKDKWNSTPISGTPFFPVGGAGLWDNGGNAPGLGVPSGVGGSVVGGSVIGGHPAGQPLQMGVPHSSGSSALASMLGIDLPTGSGSLRESSSLWGKPAQNSQLPISSLNGAPLQGVIGPSNNNTGLIGGATIGGGGGNAAVGGGGGGSGSSSNNNNPGGVGSKSDIALLQSLLPGVHITSGNTQYQPGFGAIGGGWSAAPGHGNPQPHMGSASFQVGDVHQPNNWNNGRQHQHQHQHQHPHSHPMGEPVGAIGHTAPKQNQNQAPGSIW